MKRDSGRPLRAFVGAMSAVPPHYDFGLRTLHQSGVWGSLNFGRVGRVCRHLNIRPAVASASPAEYWPPAIT